MTTHRFSLKNLRLQHAEKSRNKAALAFAEHTQSCAICQRSPFDGGLCRKGDKLMKQFNQAAVRWYERFRKE